jgi:hypothetical protein
MAAVEISGVGDIEAPHEFAEIAERCLSQDGWP